jgi:hypothetical protein
MSEDGSNRDTGRIDSVSVHPIEGTWAINVES